MVTGEVRLLQLQNIDGRDEIEDFWLRNRELVFQSAKISSEHQIDSESSKNVIAAGHQTKHEEIQIGTCCICIMSSDEAISKQWFGCLTMSSRDTLATVIAKLCELVHTKWTKFTPQARIGLLRLIREMAKLSYAVHSVIGVLLRHIVGGDVSTTNTWLVESVLDILSENRAWLERNQETLQCATFRFMRLIQDHYGSASHETLLRKEVGFVVGTLRTKFAEVIPIGRDLLRLLISVCHIREFHEFWIDLIHRPGQLMPNFNGIKELLKIRTSKKFLLLNVTPEMEVKVQFLLSKVKFGAHDTHQKWFSRTYLASLASQSLRPDIIRFVCTCIIPTNEILQSDVLPRWAFCGWVLSTCTTPQSTSMSRLALVWDWLLFNENRNTIMDIEPCLLLMHHSRKNHPPTTYGILDFLLRLIKDFHAPLEEDIRRGVINSFRFVLKMGVVRSIAPILVETAKSQPISPCLQNLINTNLAEFLPPDLRPAPKVTPSEAPPSTVPTRKDQRKVSESATEGEFSPDEEEQEDGHKKEPQNLPKTGAVKEEPNLKPTDLQNRYLQILDEISRARRKNQPDDIEVEISRIREIDESLAQTIERLQKKREEEDEFLHELDNLMKEIGQFSNGSFDSEIATPVATCISRLCASSFEPVKLPPTKATEEDFEEIIGRPLYILFRHLCLGYDDADQGTNMIGNLMSLAVALQGVDERTVHHLLYYIQLQDLQNKDEKWYIYDMFCQTFAGPESSQCESSECLEIQLSINIQSLQEHDPDLLIYLIPCLFREYQRHMANNKDIIRIIVAAICPKGLMHLQARLYNGEFQMFNNSAGYSGTDLKNLLLQTLSWESFEQQAIWRLLLSHEQVPIESWISVLPALNSKDHAEAIMAISSHLRGVNPTQQVVKMLLARDEEEFVVATFYHWAKEEKTRSAFVECMVPILHRAKSKAPRQSSRKANRGADFAIGPTISQILAQLDGLRLYGEPGSFGFYKCTPAQKKRIEENRMKVLHDDAMLASLLYLRNNCDTVDKEKYNDLLNCFPDSDEVSSEDEQPLTQKRKRKEEKRKVRQSKKRTQPDKSPQEVTVIDDDSDEVEEVTTKKKRI